MILGLGDGTFAILFFIILGIVGTLFGSYVCPRLVLPIGLACAAMPFIAYGCIISSPHDPVPAPLPQTSYNRERPFPTNPDEAVVVDYLFPVRVVLMVLTCGSLLAAAGYYVVRVVVLEPPFKAPRVQCLREQLEEEHPTWYR
ncbi:uncharacterized protein TEOVI_000094000 [Trypanosoma equiperdum]|uniref:Transmembrane protein n=3 Tax=Trypanozoon TaxID=39700 RepID=Q57UY8_TRYB2|nr:hypothetical protein, conserved [Trypanosoma brucei gambiense DAL972]XP_847294.1 hypothetical protein, conserved [Trypanosoma brucei brucei TREU927]AAX70581.1 hypothetical protein, conserved [Trypanosoma brucei]SCU69374.1 hypothetical protein, conserved [Trypanosoma equiperdum]AAZ13228.1 hypothetical protein, conserved [Trypanosoma brucei brucei TREU927]CBH13502.1 hypothetical protein, conserved [Trypanosoma brucei gambiense DAL972]|eukprot:XP_011775779.1 hypothetical protein, conserved [Trypanosoma brucei gambiense DAL972]